MGSEWTYHELARMLDLPQQPRTKMTRAMLVTGSRVGSWLLAACLLLPKKASSFLPVSVSGAVAQRACVHEHVCLLQAVPTVSSASFVPVLDFSHPDTIDQVDRLDDAIMGGISTSSVQPGDGFARWGGICRTDGGGFCGFRTNPFEKALHPGANATGVYVECRLASDDEPQRRVWKVTTRTRPDRGEQLYQAPLWNLSSADFTRIRVPFSSFQLVRGPSVVKNGPPLNATQGLFQFGMTMSKFAWNRTGEIDDFRDGFFELYIKEIGLYYSDDGKEEGTELSILSRAEAKKNRSLLLKILTPILRVVFFSETSQRRKSAMRILRSERKLSRIQAIRWGFRQRRKSRGIVNATATRPVGHGYV